MMRAKDGEVAPSFQPLLAGEPRIFLGDSWRPSGRSPDRGPLPNGGLHFLMFPNDPATIIDEQLRIVHRPRGLRPTFAYPHYHVRAGLTRRLAQRIGSRAGNLHGIFKQLRAP